MKWFVIHAYIPENHFLIDFMSVIFFSEAKADKHHQSLLLAGAVTKVMEISPYSVDLALLL